MECTVFLNAGTLIGQFVPVDEVETVIPAQGEPEQFRACQVVTEDSDLPPHLKDHAERWSKNLEPEEWQRHSAATTIWECIQQE